MARIVLNTFGSFGDLHPYLAIAIELQRRGHNPVIATSEVYRAKIAEEGIEFAPVRPDVSDLVGQPDLLEKLWDPQRGSEFLIRDYLAPRIEDNYQDVLAACKNADLLLTHFAAYGGPIAAEVLKLPWLSLILQPSVFFSAYDPPVIAPVQIRHLYRLGRPVVSMIFAFGKARARRWGKPITNLRKRLGLSVDKNPVVDANFSPFGTLALFSDCFGQPQPDWPPNTQIVGFVFYDKRGPGLVGISRGAADAGLVPELRRFLDTGPPPIAFTLGSSAVMHPGEFYRESLKAVRQLGVRAVLLVGLQEREQLGPYADSVFVTDYAPYSELLPRAALTVHQGGIGTTAQALRSGRPMLVVPWAHDQPDNAERLKKLGVARVINRAQYSAARAIREITALLSADYTDRAAEIGDFVAAENGLPTACDAIERAVSRSSHPTFKSEIEAN